MPVNHYEGFKEFCIKETALYGPDPQLVTVAKMSEDQEIPEKMWRGGVGVGVWNVPTAYEIWSEFPLERAVGAPEEILPWLQQHWAGILTRQERRCVRTPEKMALYLREYARWVDNTVTKRFWPDDSYDAWWEDVQRSTTYMGRYVALKLLEYFRAYCGLDFLECPDIRADGGWSPVKALCLIRPQLTEVIFGNTSKKFKNAAIELEAAYLIDELLADGVDINFFQMQVMLCEYRTGFEKAHQYPGRSLDEELKYLTKSRAYWEAIYEPRSHHEMILARGKLFPMVALGEKNNWNGIREELGTCYPHHGYFWTDLEYDYHATTKLHKPVKRVV